MKFPPHLLIFLLLCLAACDKRTKVTLDSTIFEFSANLGPPSQKRISEAILLERKFLNSEITKELADFVKMRIDSIPFAYIIFIPFRDSIKGKTKEAFGEYAVSLSETFFDYTPVHIILTDDNFKPRKEFPFHKVKNNTTAYGIMSSRTDILADAAVPRVHLDSIELILLSDLSELYKTGEKVDVSLIGEKGIDIEITVDDARINKDTLNSQFAKMNLHPWSAMFGRKSFRFIVKNKSDKIIYKSI